MRSSHFVQQRKSSACNFTRTYVKVLKLERARICIYIRFEIKKIFLFSSFLLFTSKYYIKVIYMEEKSMFFFLLKKNQMVGSRQAWHGFTLTVYYLESLTRILQNSFCVIWHVESMKRKSRMYKNLWSTNFEYVCLNDWFTLFLSSDHLYEYSCYFTI